MSRGALVWLLVAAALASAAYVAYALRRANRGPVLSECIGVIVAIYGVGGAARIFYLVFWDQPDGIGNDDLVCLFVGAIALAWCSIEAGIKSVKAGD